jgi:hypothetical protein
VAWNPLYDVEYKLCLYVECAAPFVDYHIKTYIVASGNLGHSPSANDGKTNQHHLSNCILCPPSTTVNGSRDRYIAVRDSHQSEFGNARGSFPRHWAESMVRGDLGWRCDMSRSVG